MSTMFDTHQESATIKSLEREQSTYLKAELKAEFPRYIKGRNHEIKMKTNIIDVGSISTNELNACLDLIDHNLGAIYARLHGPTWKMDKIKEMKDSGLIYILLKDGSTEVSSKLAGFLSMRLLVDGDLSVLYLYEIQLDKAYQNNKIGSQAMKHLSTIPDKLNMNRRYLSRFYPLDGISLTVFSDNLGALKFYQAQGYKFSKMSPRDKKLKDKTIVKPPYYIMIKYSSAAYL